MFTQSLLIQDGEYCYAACGSRYLDGSIAALSAWFPSYWSVQGSTDYPLSGSVGFFNLDELTCRDGPLIPGFVHDVISSLGKRLELVKYTGRIDRPHQDRYHRSGRRPESPGGKQINQPLTLFLSSIFTACLFLQQIMQTNSCNRFWVAKIICKTVKFKFNLRRLKNRVG